MIRDFFKWTQFSIIPQSLVISVHNVSPPATAFVSSGHCIRLLQLSHSSPPVTAFDSFSYRIRLLRSLHSTPSAIAFVSFSHCIRLLQLSHSSPSVTAFDSFSHRSSMCQLNEVDELVKWSRWSREMKWMSSHNEVHDFGTIVNTCKW